jgi:hypothetical protein
VITVTLSREDADLIANSLRDTVKGMELLVTGPDDTLLLEDIARVERLERLFEDASRGAVGAETMAIPGSSPARARLSPSVGRKKRSSRHQRRRALRRAERRNRELIEGFNRAQEMYRRDQEDLARLVQEVAERVKDQPRFVIRDPLTGNTVLSDVPAEAILTADGEPAFPGKKIILPLGTKGGA